jgi:hypothetical protein
LHGGSHKARCRSGSAEGSIAVSAKANLASPARDCSKLRSDGSKQTRGGGRKKGQVGGCQAEWLPPESAWNGKYAAIGNGGFAGSMILPSMAWRLKEGYAVSGTDTGHTGGPLDATWALGHPEKIADFGWRAIHETAEASKAVIAGYRTDC